MSYNKSIRRIAIVGTGVIGAVGPPIPGLRVRRRRHRSGSERRSKLTQVHRRSVGTTRRNRIVERRIARSA